MPILPFEGRVPRIHPSAFIAPNATVIGDVEIGEGASVWYGVVLRGDLDPIRIGPRSNVQDNACLHTGDNEPVIVGADVTVGHMACLHGCTIEDGCLVGMMATVLNRSVIGRESIVGASALVPEGKVFAPRSVIIGVPAKMARELNDADVAASYRNTARYVANGARHRAMMQEWMLKNGVRW